MKILLFFIAVLILLAIYIVCSSITISLLYTHNADNDQLVLRIKALSGIYRKKISFPVIKVNVSKGSVDVKENLDADKKKKESITMETIKRQIDQTKKFLWAIKDAKPIISDFLHKVKINKLFWHSAIGTSDAALTAKISGVAWSVKGMLIALMQQTFSVRCRMDYEVMPVYHQKKSSTELECIIQIPVGKAIVTAWKLLVHYRGSKKIGSTYRKQTSNVN
ncbi:DUF2953 domain-containing protein [Bacillus sp. 1P06AnD]|uniref:DUF2953 domain-containing protein n=1 Tax=Bacillus sp. 1P06AnD TaxID=3132208 RepID=UPI0039A3C2BE